MNICSINVNTSNNRAFGHNNPWADSPYDNKKKYIVSGTTALGVIAAMALNAKCNGYSLAPKKMFKNFNKSYIKTMEYEDGPVIAIGAGSCLGGLAGGYIIDKNRENRKAKFRETLLQMTNISFPIIFTVNAANFGKKIGNKYLDKSRPKNLQTYKTKVPQGVFGFAGLIAGVFTANIIANKINEKIFHQGKGRPVQATDFSAHLDDICVAIKKIHESNVTNFIQRFVPVALMIAGNEIGNTTVENADN